MLDDRLSPHRIALRAVLRAPLGGVCAGVFLALLIAIVEGLQDDLVVAALICAAAVSVFCGLLILAVEIAAHVSSGFRYAVPAILSTLTLFAVGAGGIWMVAIVEGRGMAWAVEQFLDILGEVQGEPDTFGVIAFSLMLPFITISVAQLAMRSKAMPASRLLEAGLAALAGVLGFLVICAKQGSFPNDLPEILTSCAGLPACAVFGMQLGGLAEERVLAWHEQRRAAED